MHNYILKICYDYSNKSQWMAFYINGKKVIENFELDKEAIKKVYKVEQEIREFSMFEQFGLVYHLFPETEDFGYLDDNFSD